MTVTRHMTPEQFFENLLMYIEEHYPHIDVNSIYPIACYSTHQMEDNKADGKLNIAVTFHYDNFRQPARAAKPDYSVKGNDGKMIHIYDDDNLQ